MTKIVNSIEHRRNVENLLKLFNLDKMSVQEFETWVRSMTNEVVEYHRSKHAEKMTDKANKAIEDAKKAGKIK